MISIDQLESEMKHGGRICPTPARWNEFWSKLPDRRQNANGSKPPAPLILAAWHHSSDEDKRARFLLHVRWARDHGAEQLINDFLAGLEEIDWYHEEKLS